MLAGIRADGFDLDDLPEDSRLQWQCVEADGAPRSSPSSAVPLRGQRGFGRRLAPWPCRFPFNCKGMNAFTGTNRTHSKQTFGHRTGAYNSGSVRRCRSAMTEIEELADRVERLLMRHGEVQRTNALLTAELAAAASERDNLRSRLNAARSRIDVLLERLPREPATRADDAVATVPAAAALRSVG